MYHALEFFRDNLVTIVTVFGLLGWILAASVAIKNFYLKEEIEVLERPGQVRLEPTWTLLCTQDLLNHLSQVYVNMIGMQPVARETVRFVLERLDIRDDTEYDIFRKRTQLSVEIGEVGATRRKLLSEMPDPRDLDVPSVPTEEQEARFREELEELREREMNLDAGIRKLEELRRIWAD